MAKHFTDSAGDTYEVTPSESRNMLSLSFSSPETSGKEFILFYVEDADHIASMILDAAQEARK